MPGQQLQTTAFILATGFAGEHGALLCLLRSPKTTPATGRRLAAAPGEGRLDLFDEAELWLESSNQGRTWFIKEHRIVQRHEGIGRSYETLRAAAALALLISRNPVPDESRPAVAGLLRASFGALAAGGRPDITWLKALYCFLRDEGYPVKQQWWAELPAAEKDTSAQLLNQPLAAQTADTATVARIIRRLEDWVAGETEIRL